jgi:hypothetical protein
MICILSIAPDNGSSLHAVWGWSFYALSIACKRNILISVFILSFDCFDFVLYCFHLNFNIYILVVGNICCVFLLGKL